MEIPEEYRKEAQENIGKLMDGFVNTMGYPLNEAWKMFLMSNVSLQFERKQYIVIACKTTEELTNIVLKDSGKQERIDKIHGIVNSKAYWTGWAVAGYQLETGLRFSEITKPVNIIEIKRMYKTYEGQPFQCFMERLNKLRKQRIYGTNLKLCREMAGLTQPEVSEKSGIPYSEFKKYEQGRKDINKAPEEQLKKLAKVLSCEIEDMLEVTSD